MNAFTWRERRRLTVIQRRLTELKRRLDEPSYVGPSRPWAAAEEEHPPPAQGRTMHCAIAPYSFGWKCFSLYFEK
jgi:hypothetical protein